MTFQRSTVDSLLLVKVLCFTILFGNILSNPIKLLHNTSLVKCSMLHKSSACYVESSDSIPVNRTVGITTTTLQPEFENIEFCFNKTKIWLKLEWSQKTSYFKERVTGYYIHINYHGNTVGNGFKVNLNFDKIPMVSKQIRFVFDEYGVEHLIYPKTWYQVFLTSLPIFAMAETDFETDIYRDIVSPDCPSKSKLDVFWPGCDRNFELKTKNKFADYYDNKDYSMDDESIEEKFLQIGDIGYPEIPHSSNYPDINGSDYTVQPDYNNTSRTLLQTNH